MRFFKLSDRDDAEVGDSTMQQIHQVVGGMYV